MKGRQPIRFGTSGWRGVLAEDFTFAGVRALAAAVARFAGAPAERPRVLVAHDTRFLGERFAEEAGAVLAGAGARPLLCVGPTPSQPHASSPVSGPITCAPRSRSSARFACVAGWLHMFTFIAGATSSGARVASSRVEARSSARPQAIFASRSALAGATSTSSAQSASAM